MRRRYLGAIAGVSTRNLDTFRSFHNSTPGSKGAPAIKTKSMAYKGNNVKRITLKKFNVPKSWNRADRYIAFRIFEAVKTDPKINRIDLEANIPAQVRVKAKSGKISVKMELITQNRVKTVFTKLVKLGCISYDAHHASPKSKK